MQEDECRRHPASTDWGWTPQELTDLTRKGVTNDKTYPPAEAGPVVEAPACSIYPISECLGDVKCCFNACAGRAYQVSVFERCAVIGSSLAPRMHAKGSSAPAVNALVDHLYTSTRLGSTLSRLDIEHALSVMCPPVFDTHPAHSDEWARSPCMVPSPTLRAVDCEEGTRGVYHASGYRHLHLGRRFHMPLHRFVLFALTGPPTDVARERNAKRRAWRMARTVAMHLCDNPACCNIHHLAWGSVSENNKAAHETPETRQALYAEIYAREGLRRGGPRELSGDWRKFKFDPPPPLP